MSNSDYIRQLQKAARRTFRGENTTSKSATGDRNRRGVVESPIFTTKKARRVATDSPEAW